MQQGQSVSRSESFAARFAQSYLNVIAKVLWPNLGMKVVFWPYVAYDFVFCSTFLASFSNLPHRFRAIGLERRLCGAAVMPLNSLE